MARNAPDFDPGIRPGDCCSACLVLHGTFSGVSHESLSTPQRLCPVVSLSATFDRRPVGHDGPPATVNVAGGHVRRRSMARCHRWSTRARKSSTSNERPPWTAPWATSLNCRARGLATRRSIGGSQRKTIRSRSSSSRSSAWDYLYLRHKLDELWFRLCRVRDCKEGVPCSRNHHAGLRRALEAAD